MTLGHKWDMNSVYEGKVQWKSTQPPPDSDFCCPLFHRAREMTSASGHWKHISASCSSIIGDRLPPYHFPISKTISQNQSPHNCSMPPASRRDWWCFWCAAVHSGLRIPQIFVISFWLWNTSSVVRVLLCSTARWWVREACHRAGERPCVPTGLVLSGAWHTIQCLAAQPELQASKHFHWIKESPAQTDRQTDRQTALKCQSWCSGGEMHTDNEIPIGLFLSCSGQLPPDFILSKRRHGTDLSVVT